MRNDGPALDIDAVRAFVLIAELASFTRAARAVNTTQSAVSLKLKRLEARLGVRLIERTPRSVTLTARGAAFLERARELLAAHERALGGSSETVKQRLTIGISDHVAGPDLAPMLARIAGFDADLHLDVRIGLSAAIADEFEAGRFDAAVVRRERHHRGGEVLREDEFGWFAAPAYRQKADEPLRLAMLAAPCGIRAETIRALQKVKREWSEAFTGGGVAAIAAVVSAGLAIAPLARRVAPPGTVDIGPALGLPPLGTAPVVLLSRVSDARANAVLRVLAAAFRGVAKR